jgi:RHS repeat-associated protein
VKKLVRKQGGRIEATHCIGGVFEHHRWDGPATPAENNHLHVLDDRQRVALVRVGPAHPQDQGPATQFHLGDHLGSSTVVVDAAGAWVNTEEFAPYGETTFGSFAKKRYRFTGKERDEESGLNYHTARYYAPWLGRWASPDPIGMKGGVNAYSYCHGSPIAAVDPRGTDPEEPPDKRPVTARDVHAARNSGNAPEVPDTRPVTARELHAHRNLGNAPQVPVAPQAAESPAEVDQVTPAAAETSSPGQRGTLTKGWEWVKARGRAAVFTVAAWRGEQPPVQEIEDAAAEITNKPRTPAGAGPEPDPTPPDKRLVTAQDLHDHRDLGNVQDLTGGLPSPNSFIGLEGPPGTLGSGGPSIDLYGDEALLEFGKCVVHVARTLAGDEAEVAGVGLCIKRCIASSFCRDVVKTLPTGGMPATGLSLRGGYRGLLRTPADAQRELDQRSSR